MGSGVIPALLHVEEISIFTGLLVDPLRDNHELKHFLMRKIVTLLSLSFGLMAGAFAQVSVMDFIIEDASTLVVLYDDGVATPSSVTLTNYVSNPTLDVDFLEATNTQDSVIIHLNTPISIGTFYDLTIDNVIDTFGIIMTGPETVDFVYNPQVPELVITEIMYDNFGADTHEFIEIYNAEPGPIQLGGMYMEGVDYTFPTMTVGANQTVLLAQDATVTSNFFGQTFIQWTSGDLDDGGEEIVLRNTEDVAIDSVNYDELLPWPVDPGGNGPSLELNDIKAENSMPGIWWQSAIIDVGQINGQDANASPGTVILPIIEFDAVSGQIVEGDVTFQFEISVANANSGSAIAKLEVVGGSATQAADYNILSPQFINFPKDSINNVVVNLTIEDDNLTEALETIEFQLNTPVNAELGTQTTYTVNLLDNDSIQTGGDLVISEIMYDLPGNNNESLEFIELHNRGVGALDVSGYSFTSGVDVVLNSNTIPAGGYYVISADSFEFVTAYGFSPDQRWRFGDNLDDDGVRLELRDPNGNLINRVNYKDQAPWPTNPVNDAASIVLCDPTLDNSVAGSWTKAFVPVNGLTVEGKQVRAHPDGTCEPVIAFGFNDYAVLESDEKQFTFPVVLFNANGTASSVDVSIDAATSSASSGSDFNFVTQTVDFPVGTDTAEFGINILNDTDLDPDDTITFVFSNPVNAVFLGSMVLRIVDDESTGLADQLSQDAPLQLFPNPSRGEVVRLSKMSSITVLDMLGQQVDRVNNTNTLDVSSYEKGIYLVRSDAGEVVRMVVR